jgi:hypothetical protein
MKIVLDDLTIRCKNEISGRITEDWEWLIGTDKTVVMISAIGDMFLKENNQNIYWLDVGCGTLEMVATSIQEFEKKLTDYEQVNEWFMIDLITALRSGKKLNEGELYSYKKLPAIGGDYSVDNFEPTDIEVHFGFAAQIHQQIKDLPDGTEVNVKFTD